MSDGTAPAWQAREMERQKLLEGIQQQVEDAIEHDRPYLYRALLDLVGHRLENGSFSREMLGSMSGNHWQKVAGLVHVLHQVALNIERFERAPAEGNALWAKLLEWAAGNVAAPYHTALHDAEFAEPFRIYGKVDRTDEVPIPD